MVDGSLDIDPERRKQKKKHQFAVIPNCASAIPAVGRNHFRPPTEPGFPAERPNVMDRRPDHGRPPLADTQTRHASGHLMAAFGGLVHWIFKRGMKPSGQRIGYPDQRFQEKMKGKAMKKALMAVATAATLAVAVLAAPQTAEARGGRIAAGVAAGVIGGALIGGALAGPGFYGPGVYGAPVYGPAPGFYGGPAYVAAPPCFWQRQRFWDGFAWRTRKVRVCS